MKQILITGALALGLGLLSTSGFAKQPGGETENSRRRWPLLVTERGRLDRQRSPCLHRFTSYLVWD